MSKREHSRVVTPVRISRWTGGKAWLTAAYPHTIALPARGGRLFDCFAGSCVIALWALAQGYRVVIGDTNPRLIGTLRNLKTRCEDVIALLADIAAAYSAAPDQRADFYARREHLNTLDPSDIGAAAGFLFILRAGFNGLWRENSSGACNTPVGDIPPRTDLVQAADLRAVGALLARADIRLGDFVETSRDIRRSDTLFADAPYAGTFTGYSKRGWTRKDRARLGAYLRELDRRGVRWTATDSAAHGALSDYGLWHITPADVRRSGSCKAEGRGMAAEVIVTNFLPASKNEAA